MDTKKAPQLRHGSWLILVSVVSAALWSMGLKGSGPLFFPFGFILMLFAWKTPKKVPIWVLLFGFGAAVYGAFALAAIPTGSIGMRSSAPADLPRLEEVCHAPTPTIVVFSATWCGPCKELEEGTLKDPAVVERLKGREVEIVDVEKNPALARQAMVRNLPTVYYVTRTCASKDVFEGYKSPETFIKWLDEVEKPN